MFNDHLRFRFHFAIAFLGDCYNVFPCITPWSEYGYIFPCYSGIFRSSHDFPWIMYGKTSTSTSPQKTRAKQEEDLTDRVGMSRANTRKTKQQDLANENSNWLVFEIDNRPGYLSRKTTNKPLSRKSSMTVIGSCNYRMISLSPKPITHWLEGGQTDFWDFFVQKLCGSSGNYWGISLNLHQLRLCS